MSYTYQSYGNMGYYVPAAPYPYPTPCAPGLFTSVGAAPAPSSGAPVVAQNQMSDELQQRMILFGVIAVLAGAAVIYQTRKH